MPDEAQPLTAAKPETASAPAATPAKNATSGPVEHAQSAPDGKAAEQPRPKPAPSERPAKTPAVRSAAAPSGRPSSSSNRVRARLARLGVQRSNPYNPVLEPLLRIVRSNDPEIQTSTPPQLEYGKPVAERGAQWDINK
ncbi:GTP pyrophosphokinase, partial [Streptomyces mirabilis]